jgi:YD repeat-containing protein
VSADGSDQVSEEDYTYDNTNIYNRQVEQDEYDFGSGSHGPLIRNTCTTWTQYANAPPGAYLLDLALTRKVFSNNVGCTAGPSPVAETDYTYDNAAQYPSGSDSNIANHDSSIANSSKGNVTAVAETLNDPVNGNQPPLTSYSYFDIAGNVIETIDPRGVRRDYGYGDATLAGGLCTAPASGPTYAFPTSVTSYPTLGSTSSPLTAYVCYDYALGKPTGTKDVNGNTTRYAYEPANTGTGFDRLQTVTRPDGGATVFTYNDAPSPGPVSVKTATNQVSGDNGAMQSYMFYDGLGREEETSKRAGTQVIDVCKTYDARNRVASVSNPAFSSAGFGGVDTTVCGANATTYSYL